MSLGLVVSEKSLMRTSTPQSDNIMSADFKNFNTVLKKFYFQCIPGPLMCSEVLNALFSFSHYQRLFLKGSMNGTFVDHFNNITFQI